MPRSQIENARRNVRRFLWLQGLVIIALSLLFWAFLGQKAGYSALLGGMVCLIPTGFFAWLAFRYTGAQSAQRIVGAFYMGEALKLFLTMALFTVIFIWIDVVAVPFFGAFIATQGLVWLAPCVFKLTN